MYAYLNEEKAAVNMKRIEDEKFIYNLFRSLARKKEVEVSVHYRKELLYGHMIFYDRKGKHIEIVLQNNLDRFSEGERAAISFFNKDIYYEFTLPFRNASPFPCQIDRPSVLFSSYRRMVIRHPIADTQHAAVYFEDTGESCTVVDISTRGLSFLSTEKIFAVGQTVLNFKVSVGDRLRFSADGKIKYCQSDAEGKCIYGVAFLDMDWATYYAIFEYIFEESYPSIRYIHEFSREEIHTLYQTYFARKPGEDLSGNFANMLKTLEILKGKPQIALGLVYLSNGQLLSTASALRIYDRTILGHQLVSIPKAITHFRSKADIYLGLTDYITNHLYYECFLSYYLSDVSWHDELFQEMGRHIGDRKKFMVDLLEMYECRTDLNASGREKPGEYACVLQESPSHFLQYCAGSLEELEITCYGYTKEHFDLFEIKQLYENVGLQVVRRLFEVIKGDGVAAYAVAEVYSDGLNLVNLTDMCRVYFVPEPADIRGVFRTLLPELAVLYGKYGKKKFNLVYKAPEGERQVPAIPGTALSNLSWGRVIMSKEGGCLYRKLLAGSFRQAD